MLTDIYMTFQTMPVWLACILLYFAFGALRDVVMPLLQQRGSGAGGDGHVVMAAYYHVSLWGLVQNIAKFIVSTVSFIGSLIAIGVWLGLIPPVLNG